MQPYASQVDGAPIVVSRTDDAALLCRLAHESFAEYEGRLSPPSAAMHETAESIERELRNDTIALVATSDDTPVGCVLARPKGRHLYFGRLSVVPSLRRKGVAAALVQAVQTQALNAGLDGIDCSVRIALEANQRFFLGLGFVEVGRTAHPGFNEHTSIDYRKTLDNASD